MDERELVRRAREGDSAAFEALVTAYETKIYNLAFRYLGSREDALDASQEVFLRVFRFLGGFQEESGFSTWLYRIGVNVCKDMFQRKKRLNETSLERIGEDEEDYVTDIPDERFRPDAVHDQTELRDALARAIGELPGPQREIVILRDIQGLSYEEIAGALALESGTVKSRLSRARENLRKKLLRNGNISAPQGSNRLKGGKADEILR